MAETYWQKLAERIWALEWSEKQVLVRILEEELSGIVRDLGWIAENSDRVSRETLGKVAHSALAERGLR